MRLLFVFFSSLWYSKSPVDMDMYTVPITFGSSTWLPSSSKMAISEMGHAFPTVPGLVSHSWAVTRVPPPSDAA